MESNSRCEKNWVGKVAMCLCLLLVLLVPLSCAGRVTMGIATTSGSVGNSSIQKHEVHETLKNLNRLPIKTIRSPDGDIIDCVHIYNQPAFDHPALKNHKIRMRPSFYPKGNTFEESKVSSNSNKPVTQLWHKNGRCPEGTIPIRRTKKDDILRSSSIQNFGKKKQGSMPQPNSDDTPHEYAIAITGGDKYYGTQANINVWNPSIEGNGFSVSQMWVVAGYYGNNDLNTIEAGWQIQPNLFGDYRTRLFIYWTRDNYKSTGCYNLKCPGFIQVNRDISLGTTLWPISEYGSDQYEISLLIWKDPDTGDWWLNYGKNHTLGYWPAHLFTYLSDSASIISWGGEIANVETHGQHTTTQMGSGHFPNEGFRKASYFNQIKIVDGTNTLRDPKELRTRYDKEKCYSIKTGYANNWGNYFYYGGPGRNLNCP